MTTRMTDIDTHPDLGEMRTRYARVSQSPWVGLLNGVVLLAGLYAVLSPWVIGNFSQFGLAASNVIVGLALALLAVGYALAFDRLHTIAWVTPVMGVWLIVSPWVIYRGSGIAPLDLAAPPLSVSTWISNVVVGGVVVVVGSGIPALNGARWPM